MFVHAKKIILLMLMCLFLSGCDDGPSEVELARDEGISCMNQGDYEDAAVALEKAFSLCDEKMPQTKMDISLYEAACQFRLGDYEAVKDICSRALNLLDHVDAYYLRGAAFLKLNETEAAKADFDAASLLAPGDYQMYFNIYKQYEEQNLSAVGDEYLQKALAIPGEEMEDYYQKGSIYFYLQDYAKAQEMLAKPAEAKHKNAMMLMGEVYLKLDDSIHARNVFQQYLDEYGEDAAAYNGLVLCDIAEGNYEAAISMAQTGLALEGAEDAVRRELFYNQVVAYEDQYDFAAAAEVAQQLIEEYPDDEQGQKEYEFLQTR